MSNSSVSPEDLLFDTPYLTDAGYVSAERFTRVQDRAQSTRARAQAAWSQIQDEARKVLPQFQLAVRSDLVAESNRMEGIESSAREVRTLARVRTDLLEAPLSSFVTAVREDPRVLESLGLYRAYSVGDEWARSDTRPREFEIRQLHALVMPTLASGGKYKSASNKIGLSRHIPTPVWNVQREMADLSEWFQRGTGDALLDATVVHAWLTHIHPFDDGNGRMARLLANIALIRSDYPPLLLRSSADRGEYLDALAASDDGDIFPLYDMFGRSVRRLVTRMEKPNYVEAKIRDELLATPVQRHETWRALIKTLFTCLEQKTRERPWSVHWMGVPDLADFEDLEHRNADGNCWFAKLRHAGVDQWLL